MENSQDTTALSNLATPIAIVIAGGLIAIGLFYGSSGSRPTTVTPTENEPPTVVAVTAADHIRGNMSAPVTIIEYTDLECPFCKQFHGTMQTIKNTYGDQVAWVIRNFPLEQLHPNAPRLAEAAECVAELGGNNTYWAFLDELFKRAPLNTPFDMTKLNDAVGAVGVNITAFTSCLESGRHKAKIQQEIQDAIASGGTGTPHNILVVRGEDPVLIPGSQPLDVVKAAIDKALK